MKENALDLFLTLVSLPFAAIALVFIFLLVKHMDCCYSE